MPIIKSNNYNPSLLLRNKHINTIYRTFFSQNNIKYQRKRISTPDNDFLDLDFSINKSDTIAILVHGLEGSSSSPYITSAVQQLNKANIDAVAINLRGCSGEINNLLCSYHSGKTDDLEFVINYISHNYSYRNMIIIGYSLGGNIVLKYLGEQVENYPKNLKGAITISVPCDLEGSSKQLAKLSNKIYMLRFLKSLKVKAIKKATMFPNFKLNISKIEEATNFLDFDNLYTAPVHGFKNAVDYWTKSSSKQFIKFIKLPTLLITSSDDPFLSKSCIPINEANNNENFNLIVTKQGGHVGFNSTILSNANYWLENKIISFIKSKIK